MQETIESRTTSSQSQFSELTLKLIAAVGQDPGLFSTGARRMGNALRTTSLTAVQACKRCRKSGNARL